MSKFLAVSAWVMVFALSISLAFKFMESDFISWFFWTFFLVVAFIASSWTSRISFMKNLLRGETVFIQSIDMEKRTIKFQESPPKRWEPGDPLMGK